MYTVLKEILLIILLLGIGTLLTAMMKAMDFVIEKITKKEKKGRKEIKK